jgi:2-oxoglutarate dehydrogenase E2 component (dihydrolipoamide succinyltransferase)
MSQEIKVPAVGESIQEVQIGEWYVKEGQWVAADTPIVGLETDKATFDVPAPADGKVTRIAVPAGQVIAIGTVIGIYEQGAKSDSAPATSSSKASAATPAPASAPVAATPAPVGSSSGGSSSGSGGAIVMPAASRALHDKGLSAGEVTATGPGGRLLKEDVQNHQKAIAPPQLDSTKEGRKVPLTGIRKAIARRLVEAQQNAALLTTFNEADMTAIKEFRAQYQDQFTKKYGIKLGFMSFFVKAVVDALLRIPQVGAQIKGDNLYYPETYDIGVAVGGGKGLVVPVLRSAERLSFAEIEQKISDFGQRAQVGKIMPQELEGGCFTISNGGVYGSLLSTPIVNPPQSGVLGMHNIVDRPIALNGQVVIRPMMYLALTYDHRVIDGREAVTFLKRIREALEEPMRMILEV